MINWLRHIFAVHANRPCALIMDGYGSHWVPGMRAAAEELSIELISMPPNMTNEIQPLDVGVFGALQKMTDRDWESNDSVADYLRSFQQSWSDFSSVSIRKAFYSALALEEGVLEDDNSILLDEQNAINSIDRALQKVIDTIPE